MIEKLLTQPKQTNKSIGVKQVIVQLRLIQYRLFFFQTHDWTEDADELEDRNIYFSPDQGNVVFASALDGWGFTYVNTQFSSVANFDRQHVYTPGIYADEYIVFAIPFIRSYVR